MITRIKLLQTLVATTLIASNFSHAKQETYGDIQSKRQLSISQNESLSDLSLAEAEKAHRNRMKVLDNEYLNLLQIEKGLSTKVQTKPADDPKLVEMRQQQAFQRKLAMQKDQDIDKLISEMESQIFLVDVYEVAGLIRGEFWYQGANEVLTENAIFGDWLVKKLNFEGALVVPIDPNTGMEKKNGQRNLRLMSEEEAISRFKKAQAFRDQIVENKLSEVSLGGFSTSPATFMPNSSPSEGLMFR
ncbi:hypothetical protein OCT63_18365 [Vibrio sp. RW]|uniref:hypothetical protein n=1 Tax=Vibrio sp. RW TaxID=2998833 RepID=UPI0022CD4970|nr:hypothetical protein [Vibrio sp. RW]MDA0146194.1 hypothetical protein [Vibrio sp. RW]